MTTHLFYKNLPALERFAQISDLSCYEPVPDDWHIIVADIVNSTVAVRSGQYKTVNLLGVSVISSILNGAGTIEIPYIFGGDGASLCIPPELLAASRQALMATRQLAREAFSMELRVGIVPVREIHKAGLQMLCAKHRVSAYCTQAAFAGGGVEHAESLLKSDAEGVDRLTDPQANSTADYSGLECRWDNVPSPHGETIALIVRSLAPSATEQAAFYREVIEKIGQLYGDVLLCRPVSVEGLQPTYASAKLSLENLLKNYRNGTLARIKHALTMRIQNVLGWIFMNFNLRVGGVDWGQYKPDVVSNTDFRKFDGVLRQVISGTAAQREQLDQYLREQFEAGRCVYGIHRSDSALITCLVSNRSGNHYHFVDGADGGYAIAALAMKQQLKTLREQKQAVPA